MMHVIFAERMRGGLRAVTSAPRLQPVSGRRRRCPLTEWSALRTGKKKTRVMRASTRMSECERETSSAERGGREVGQ